MHEHTHITGYFNPNNFPISINSPKIGVQVVIQPGSFLVDRQNMKVNDPLLEQFVGPGRLSRERSPEPVPVRRLATPGSGTIPINGSVVSTRPPMNPPISAPLTQHNSLIGITRAPAHTVISERKLAPVINPDVTGPQPATRPIIIATSVADAEKRGLIGRAKPLPDNLEKRSVIAANSEIMRAASANRPTTPAVPVQVTQDLFAPKTDPDLELSESLERAHPAKPQPAPAAVKIEPAPEPAVAQASHDDGLAALAPVDSLPDPDVADQALAPAPQTAAQPSSAATAEPGSPQGVPSTYANLTEGTPVVVNLKGKHAIAQYIEYSTKYKMPVVLLDGKRVVRKILRVATEDDVKQARNS